MSQQIDEETAIELERTTLLTLMKGTLSGTWMTRALRPLGSRLNKQCRAAGATIVLVILIQ
jgi:hypothetical protein